MDTETLRIFSTKIKIYFQVFISSTTTLTLLPVAVGIAIALGWIWFTDRFELPAEPSQEIVLAIFFFLFSLSGIVFIVRREIPPVYFIKIEGPPAVIIGVIWFLYCIWLSFSAISYFIVLRSGV